MAHIQDDRTLLASAKALRAEILACADQIEADRRTLSAETGFIGSQDCSPAGIIPAERAELFRFPRPVYREVAV